MEVTGSTPERVDVRVAFLKPFFMRFVNMDKLVGGDFEKGLAG